jgi:hypothetical protein
MIFFCAGHILLDYIGIEFFSVLVILLDYIGIKCASCYYITLVSNVHHVSRLHWYQMCIMLLDYIGIEGTRFCSGISLTRTVLTG